MRVDGRPRVDPLEIEDRACGGRASAERPAVARGLRGPRNLVVERLRQRAVPGRAAVAPDQDPAAGRCDRARPRQTSADRRHQHVARGRDRRARDGECRAVRCPGSDGDAPGQGAERSSRAGDRDAQADRQRQQREVAAEERGPVPGGGCDSRRAFARMAIGLDRHAAEHELAHVPPVLGELAASRCSREGAKVTGPTGPDPTPSASWPLAFGLRRGLLPHRSAVSSQVTFVQAGSVAKSGKFGLKAPRRL